MRDGAGNVISTTICGVILVDSLHVTQAINDEPDTCSFTLRPQATAALVPQTGDEIRITWAPGGPPLFHGYVLVVQSDWRVNNLQPPWVAIQCQDPMWRFDARIVTYRFPTQSVTDSIRFLVAWFCNLSPTTQGPLDFTLGNVQVGMPSIPAFDVVNQRPSTVLRTLTAAVNGGFYIAGLTVHAWANSASEPNQTNPIPLTVGLKTLHTVRRIDDASQVRRRVLVEGRRTAALTGFPTTDKANTEFLGLPLEDAAGMLPSGVDVHHLSRVGTQWMTLTNAISVTTSGANPPQATTKTAFTPGQTALVLNPMAVTPPAKGWIRVGNQYSCYALYTGTPATGITVQLPVASFPYGVFTEPIAVGALVEWVDAVMAFEPHGFQWTGSGPPLWQHFAGDTLVRSHPPQTPVVTLAVAQMAIDRWPPLEGFVQDGRYSYAGAQGRADSDLAAFQHPLVSMEWETDDLNAQPGRSQEIALVSAAINPGLALTVTILRVEITFPLRTLPPRRRCTGGIVKPSAFLDLVVTTQN